ncbi:MAG: hypothetical protein QOE95_523, partial [Gaiellaceae bacterium]|nr:hypothetical protein [Gaiellaceae bacterium]
RYVALNVGEVGAIGPNARVVGATEPSGDATFAASLGNPEVLLHRPAGADSPGLGVGEAKPVEMLGAHGQRSLGSVGDQGSGERTRQAMSVIRAGEATKVSPPPTTGCR